jgi:hypothetical protein
MATRAFTTSVESIGIFDVIVAGAGSAGLAAAIAAARSGARTLLLERHPFLGGTSTAVLDTFYGFYTPGSQSIKVVGGIGDDVVAHLTAYRACLQRPNTYGAGTGITYNSEYLKVVWEAMVEEAGCNVLLNAWVQQVDTAGDRIASVLVATRQGLKSAEARTFIDATGDADLCFFAGSPYELAGEKTPAQMLTTTFKVVNVDSVKRNSIGKEELHRRMAAAAESGRYDLPRREGSDHITPIEGMYATNMTRVQSFQTWDGETRNATDPAFLTTAEICGRRQALEYMRFLRDCVPGYEDSELVSFGTQIGVRETRRIYGEYRLTREDVLSAKQFDDQIGLCGAPIEDHHEGCDTDWQYLPDGLAVGIPFRTLLPQKIENLLVVGRCFSASHDAHASVRSMAQCMAMGEAAGTAAAMACHGNQELREIRVAALQDALRSNGAILQVPR